MSVKNNPHGWAIVGLTYANRELWAGFYNMSVYINRLSAQLAVSSADTSFAVSLFFVVGGVAGLYMADLLRVWSVRKVVIAGALVSGVAVALVGFADQFAGLCLIYIRYRQCRYLNCYLHDANHSLVSGPGAINGPGCGDWFILVVF